jgi:hypothetical protein
VELKAQTHLNWYLLASPGILALYFGQIPAVIQWSKDVLAEYTEQELVHTQGYNYMDISVEICNARMSVQVLVRLGRLAEACAVLEAMGFVWSDDGFARYDSWVVAIGETAAGMIIKDDDAVFHRLLLFSALPQSDALDAEVGAWIPTPAVLAQHERDQAFCQNYPCLGVLTLAASVFLRLGRDGDAAEAARILVSPEHHCVQAIDLAHGHGVLGQVAARQGDLEAAGGHFGRALSAATTSRYPLVEVIAARDWKRAVPDCGVAADAVIDAACAKMGKTRAQLALVL